MCDMAATDAHARRRPLVRARRTSLEFATFDPRELAGDRFEVVLDRVLELGRVDLDEERGDAE
jgi:hypothetical protein